MTAVGAGHATVRQHRELGGLGVQPGLAAVDAAFGAQDHVGIGARLAGRGVQCPGHREQAPVRELDDRDLPVDETL